VRLTYQGGNSGLLLSTTFFVPLTIGLSILVASMQTAWFIKKDSAHLRMTKFLGKLFLINFAVGVVTGIVLEFQFGMNHEPRGPVVHSHRGPVDRLLRPGGL
jgi:hypothetical protein